MMILLPREINGLGQLERTLTVELLDQLQAKSQLREVGVSIPRFKVGSSSGLGRELQLMGMSRAFQRHADFTGISELRPLFIDLVNHRALGEVDEKGTEATAATTVALTHGGSMPTAVFNADHPFLFLILHRPTGTILFIGRITDPSK